MKIIAILLLSTFSLSASAQTKTTTSRTDVSQSIKDDGTTLHFIVNNDQANKHVHYDHIFDVAGMSSAQKDAMLKKITDSLGIAPPPPKLPAHHESL